MKDDEQTPPPLPTPSPTPPPTGRTRPLPTAKHLSSENQAIYCLFDTSMNLIAQAIYTALETSLAISFQLNTSVVLGILFAYATYECN